MAGFVHESHPQRVRFASGRAAEAVGEEVDRLASRRIMVIAGESESELADFITAGLPVAVRHAETAMHVPVDVAGRARERATARNVDLVVSIGGGSTTGLAKAVALTTGLSIIAVPTTYAGSEATNVWGLTDDGQKMTGVDSRVLPIVVVYDATLTTSLPVEMTVASGLNALAHCVDAMWGPNADPIDRVFAVEGIATLRDALPNVVSDPSDLTAREQMLYATYLSGRSFSSAGSGLHHKICHVLGGMHDLPHARTHAMVLPYVVAFNSPALGHLERRLADAFGARTALEGLERLRDAVSAPRALAEIGFQPDDVERTARTILPLVPGTNPRQVDFDDLVNLLDAARVGVDVRSFADQSATDRGSVAVDSSADVTFRRGER